MSWITGVRARSHQLLWRAAAEERIRFHIKTEPEKNLREGVTQSEARRRAAIAFGAVQSHKEEVP